LKLIKVDGGNKTFKDEKKNRQSSTEGKKNLKRRRRREKHFSKGTEGNTIIFRSIQGICPGNNLGCGKNQK
jgi:hypothetical protein